MTRASWVSIAVVIVIVLVAVLDRVGLVDIVSPGLDNDSNTTSSPSGLETIERDITMLRGCSDSQVLEWDESNDIWVCTTVTSVVTLVNPGGDADSTTTTSPSGQEIISSKLTLLRGCENAEFLQWTESTDVWGCSNTLTSPTIQTSPTASGATWADLGTVTTADINGGTWQGTIDGASIAAAALTFNDDVTASFGTGEDSTISYDGTDTFWDLQNVGTGDLLIAFGDGFPSPDAGTVHIWSGDAGTGAPVSGTRLVIESATGNAFISFATPNSGGGDDQGLRFGDNTNVNVGAITYHHSNDRMEVRIANLLQLDWKTAAFAFQRETTVSTSTGNLIINPTANTDVSSDPLIIQNVSQNTTPGTTTDGQIRLWEDADAGGGASDGRILYQINGTTYQLNADAGITFTNNPLILARDKALFTAGHAQWKLGRVAQADEEFTAFSAKHPELELVRMEPEWSIAYLEHLVAQYSIADAILNPNGDEVKIPYVPTVQELKAENPWPDPSTYTIADAASNETVSPRTGTQFKKGDSLVLGVDRVKINPVTGEAWGVHTVPALLKDEILHLLQTDAQFLAQVKALLGLP